VQCCWNGDLVSDAVELAEREIDTRATTSTSTTRGAWRGCCRPNRSPEYPHLRERPEQPALHRREQIAERPTPTPRQNGRRIAAGAFILIRCGRPCA